MLQQLLHLWLPQKRALWYHPVQALLSVQNMMTLIGRFHHSDSEPYSRLTKISPRTEYIDRAVYWKAQCHDDEPDLTQL
eukprot:EC724136.1.p2 GENE.EC724136.1~~EC724136.1.p2  ORF type:complete len:79 (-),score=5.48 EC724136.1:158-394(-)